MKFFKARKLAMALAISVASCISAPIQVAAAGPVNQTAPQLSICSESSAILGTPGDDQLVGTAGDDVICAFEGNDVVDGLGGNDVIFSGTGDDTVSGGDGTDQIVGESGNDSIEGGPGADSIWGSEGLDDLSGGLDDDYISGGIGADNLWGGNGLDALFAGAGDDGLDGGLGQDYLDGESGSNTCTKDLTDTTKKCFFDNKAPVFSAIAIDPGTSVVDSTQTSKVVKVRVFASDPGAGVAHIYMSFMPKQEMSGSPARPHPVGCSSENLVAGTPNRGVYELSCEITPNCLKGTYVLEYIRVVDLVGNSRDWSYPELQKRKLAVSFRQSGNPDIQKPAVRNLKVIQNSVIENKDQQVLFQAEYSDFGQSGVENVSLFFNSSGYKWSGNFNLWIPSWEIPICQGELDFRICKTPLDDGFTRIHYPISMNPAQENTLANFYGPGLMTLSRVVVQDFAGNVNSIRAFTNQTLQDTQIDKRFLVDLPKNKSDGDLTAPKIISFSLDKTALNTSGGEDEIIATVHATDSGIGFASQSIPFHFRIQVTPYDEALGQHVDPPYDGNQNYDLQLITRSVVSKVGRPNDMTVKIAIRFPAHYPRFKAALSISVVDWSQKRNRTTWSTSQLKKLKLPFEVTNG